MPAPPASGADPDCGACCMLILSNGLAEVVDEGFLKVANSLIKRLKEADPKTFVVSYDQKSSLTDRYLELNKFLLSRDLIALLRKETDPVLYVPAPAKPWATALRIFLLSMAVKKKPYVLAVMNGRMGKVAKWLLKGSGARFMVLSKGSETFYKNIVSPARVTYLKAGVDTQKFCPVSPEEAASLKAQYGLDPDRPVVLHMGHMQEGRNLRQLMKLNPDWQIVLVISTLYRQNQDLQLRKDLLSCPNITLLEEYLPKVEEVCQMADVYFFPVEAEGQYIDLPLSVMEAAACDKPIVATAYGALKEFMGKEGFYFIDSFEETSLNALICKALSEKEPTRRWVLDRDWSGAVSRLQELKRR